MIRRTGLAGNSPHLTLPSLPQRAEGVIERHYDFSLSAPGGGEGRGEVGALPTRRLRCILFAVLAAFLVAAVLPACGKKGPPDAPGEEKPVYPRPYPAPGRW